MRIAVTVLLAVLPLLVWSAWVYRRNRSIVREQQRQQREVEDPCMVYLQAQQRALDGSLARLRDSQGGRGHRYDVPWYLVLGEENAGKSSFVSRSDQRFALTRTERSSTQGPPPIRTWCSISTGGWGRCGADRSARRIHQPAGAAPTGA